MTHPIISAEHGDIPSLRLVLPGHLSRDETLAGLAGAIGEVRTGLAIRAWLCRQLEEDCAASGEQVSEALCRGQALGAENAAAQLDEAIIAVFGLWGQYQVRGTEPQQPDDMVAAGMDPAGDGQSPAEARGRRPQTARFPGRLPCSSTRREGSRCPRR